MTAAPNKTRAFLDGRPLGVSRLAETKISLSGELATFGWRTTLADERDAIGTSAADTRKNIEGYIQESKVAPEHY